MKNKKVIFIIPFVFLSLFLGIYTGWLRMGWNLPVTNSMAYHGLLMVGSFLGTLIILERVVVLKKSWLYVFPALNGLSLPTFYFQQETLAVILLITGTLGLLYIFGIIYRKFRERYILIMMAGALLLLGGDLIVLSGKMYATAVPFWMGFLLLTIVGERLDLGKFMPSNKFKNPLLYLSFLLFIAGLFADYESIGHLLGGTGMLIMAFWLLKYDIVRRSIKSHGLTRYVGTVLFSGYVWLLITAVLMLWGPDNVFSYDALLHSFFLGFTFLMIFAHAPIIFPGVAGLSFKPFHPSLYLWAVLLNISLLLRIGADHMSSIILRQAAGLANGLTLLGFFVNLIILVRIRLVKNKPVTDKQPKPSILYMKLALILFLLIGLIGILIRWHFLYPVPGFNYMNWLHAHSHVAFLGWAFMGLLALVSLFYEDDPSFPGMKLKNLAWLILAANAGMLLSFPAQGYGPVSIFFSAVHMALGIYGYILLVPVLHKNRSFGSGLINWGFIFMMISGFGPLALGPIVAFGLKSTHWYNDAIYFYLHFQYNGFFTLAIIGLICKYLERDEALIEKNKALKILAMIVTAVCLTFLLSLLSNNPPALFYFAGGMGAVLQVVVMNYILILILKRFQDFKSRIGIYTNILLVVSLAAFETKLWLQALTTIPVIADWVFAGRHIIIAYLHMVLLGFVSMFIIGWWHKLSARGETLKYGLGVISYFFGFLGMEVILLLLGLGVFANTVFPFEQLIIFSASVFIGVLLIFIDVMKRNKKVSVMDKQKEINTLTIKS